MQLLVIFQCNVDLPSPSTKVVRENQLILQLLDFNHDLILMVKLTYQSHNC